MDVCTKSNGDTSESCQDRSIETKNVALIAAQDEGSPK